MHSKEAFGARGGHLTLSGSLQFCALGYRPRGLAADSSEKPMAVLLVLRNQEGELRFFVRSGWLRVVSDADLDYLESLFRDFLERAKSSPDALFKQLSSLGVGPLTTEGSGLSLDDYPSILKLLSEFIEL